MKRALLVGLGLAALATPSAAQGVFDDFDGFYAGVLIGATGASVSGYYAGTGGGPVVTYNYALYPTGLSLGGLAGYEFPWQQFVLRIEGDVAIVLGATQTFNYATGPRSDTYTVNSTAHVRGIAGMPVGQFVPFLAFGVGLASVTANHTGPGGPGTWTQSSLLVGPSIGAGTDIELGDGLTVRLEVLADFFASTHYDWATGRYSDIATTVWTARAGITSPL